MQTTLNQFDPKEIVLPDTVMIRDIENRVFQAIVVRCLSEIEGVAPGEGSLFASLLGREGQDCVRGVDIEQEDKKRSVAVRVEVNIAYGISIPEKAEEIQTKIAQEINRLTGLRVSRVHVIFKDLIQKAD
jgi:uncharacterized alkaline shock family protein YloU